MATHFDKGSFVLAFLATCAAIASALLSRCAITEASEQYNANIRRDRDRVWFEVGAAQIVASRPCLISTATTVQAAWKDLPWKQDQDEPVPHFVSQNDALQALSKLETDGLVVREGARGFLWKGCARRVKLKRTTNVWGDGSGDATAFLNCGDSMTPYVRNAWTHSCITRKDDHGGCIVTAQWSNPNTDPVPQHTDDPANAELQYQATPESKRFFLRCSIELQSN
jgi:hypothetical protein